MITRSFIESALHHVPDALSRMYEEDDNKDTVTTAIGQFGDKRHRRHGKHAR